jgi:Rod binding domain-containing protein
MKITPDFSSQVSTGAEKQKDSKLVDAAQQFEAMLMQEMLKPMRAGQNDWSGEENDDSAADTISTFGTEAVAKAISKGGGFGIARQVVRQVTREHEKNSENKTAGY